MKCDHGIAFDRWCGECEWDLLSDDMPEANEGARWASVLAAIGLVVLVVVAVAAQANR